MPLPVVQVDACTDRPFAGNPAPVCVLPSARDAAWSGRLTAVRGLQPDFGRLRALPVRGVIVTSRATTEGVDFGSRFFAPRSGVDEDPVTGSAHCCLTPFWNTRLGKTEFVALQVSARGGVLRLRLDGDRVRLRGQAVTVLKGELTV